jgi:hypothetical protein
MELFVGVVLWIRSCCGVVGVVLFACLSCGLS